MDRRAFCSLVAASIVGAGQGCGRRPGEAPEAGLVRLLNLQPAETPWLDALSPRDRQALYDALTAGKPISEHGVDLLMKVLGRRERLFAYVGYPPATNSLSACNGLLRE
jgi:hypothetical protein